MTFAFSIPVKKPKDEAERQRLDILLSLTLDSVFQQTSDDFMVVVCGHVRPEFALSRHPRTIWLEAPFPAPTEPGEGRNDKHRKRAHIAAYLRQFAPLYIMALDGDDLIHRDLVAFTHEHGGGAGVYFEEGYALDFALGHLAPMPGVWRGSFHSICGSSAVVHYQARDLPRSFDDARRCLFTITRSHTRVLVNTAERGLDLVRFPGPGGVYALNNGTNLSFDLLVDRRVARVARRTIELAVPEPLETIRVFVDPARYLDARASAAAI